MPRQPRSDAPETRRQVRVQGREHSVICEDDLDYAARRTATTAARWHRLLEEYQES
jgi:hypothetical protein